MSWNEPGNGKDPWGNHDGPADLDELLQELQKRFKKWFGQKSGKNGSSGAGWLWIIPLIIVIWGLTGIYRVDSAEQAVVLRFGAYQTTAQPGLHWHWPWPIEQAKIVNTAKIRSFTYSYEMLTADENIVQIAIAVQYVVDNAYQYVFDVRRPNMTLGEVSESAIRQVVGANKMNYILGKGQSEVASATKKQAQHVLDEYQAGLKVLSVNLQKVQPPKEVQDAFDDVNKAREDKQRLQNEAQSYANSVVPDAQGQAAHIVQKSKAYKAQTVAEAKGRAQRFDSVYAAYKKAPKITKKRLYISDIESVLSQTPKVLVDPSVKSGLLYMPLDKLFKSNAKASTHRTGGAQ